MIHTRSDASGNNAVASGAVVAVSWGASTMMDMIAFGEATERYIHCRTLLPLLVQYTVGYLQINRYPAGYLLIWSVRMAPNRQVPGRVPVDLEVFAFCTVSENQII